VSSFVEHALRFVYAIFHRHAHKVADTEQWHGVPGIKNTDWHWQPVLGSPVHVPPTVYGARDYIVDCVAFEEGYFVPEERRMLQKRVDTYRQENPMQAARADAAMAGRPPNRPKP
jgi:hypothetical protein